MSRRLLLLSNSRDVQGRYLHHCRDALAAHLEGVRHVAFVPYAGVGVSWDAYTERVRDALAPLGVQVAGVHDGEAPVDVVRSADAIAVGGGNTFHLLATMQRTGVLDAVRARALDGTPYVGWSAGSVVACPTLGTTNDMPIIEPPAGFGALGLVRFQINAHFTDAHPPGFQGETRRERLTEYLAANAGARVIGLPEGDWLTVDGDAVTLHGAHAAALLRTGHADAWVEPGAALGRLLEG